MPPLAKFLVLLAIFVSASHANAFTCLALLLLHEIKRALFKPQRPFIGAPIPASELSNWDGNPRGFLAWLRQHTLDLGM